MQLFWQFIKILSLGLAAFLTLSTVTIALLMPPVWQLHNAELEVERCSRQGHCEVFKYGPDSADWVADIPHALKRFLITAEDWDFYYHRGISIDAIYKAYQDNQKAGRIVRGGSTLTQQLVKNAFLDFERSYIRKFRDVIGALLLEKMITKDEILTWYLNIVEFAPNVYGVHAAADYYFGKKVSELHVGELARLIAVLPNPKGLYQEARKHSPDTNFTGKVSRLLWLCLNRRMISRQHFVEGMLSLPGGRAYTDSYIREPKLAWRNPQRLMAYYRKQENEGSSEVNQVQGLPWRIAIDPGHFGGDYAELEGRSIKLKMRDGRVYNSKEGELSLAIALELEKLLLSKGYNVMLVRRNPGQGAISDSFEEWVQKNKRKEMTSSLGENTKSLFYKYNQADLKIRTRKINDYKPDLAISIHLNAAGFLEQGEEYNEHYRHNYSIVFIPTLDVGSKNHHRLAVSNTDVSEAVAKKLAARFKFKLGEALYNEPSYPKSKKVSKGVYYRKIALTRFTEVPFIFGESLFQNNPGEIKFLSDPIKTSDTGVNVRLSDIAESYFEAIHEFFSEQDPPLAH